MDPFNIIRVCGILFIIINYIYAVKNRKLFIIGYKGFPWGFIEYRKNKALFWVGVILYFAFLIFFLFPIQIIEVIIKNHIV